jgi:adenylosuccinate lyase
MLAFYMLKKFTSIVDGLQVFPDRMLENLDRSYGLVFSQPVLLALVGGGLGRDDAYRIVQRAASATWEQRRPFIDVLREDSAVTGVLSADALAACFDLATALADSGRVFDVLDALPDGLLPAESQP